MFLVYGARVRRRQETKKEGKGDAYYERRKKAKQEKEDMERGR